MVLLAAPVGAGETLSAQGTLPEPLGPSVNSSCAEINPVPSSDGKTLYFSRVNYPDSVHRRMRSQDIWSATLDEEGRWTEAERVDELNLGRFNALLAAFPDGETFAINGIFNKKGTHWLQRGVSLIRREADGTWGKPEAIRIRGYARKSRGAVANLCFAPDTQHIMLSFSQEAESWQLTLHASEKMKNGAYGRPKPVKGMINLGRSVESPFLANDSVLYFSGCYGRDRRNFDIYRCVRTGSDFRQWSTPEPLGDSINSPLWQSYYITGTNGWAYFCSISGAGSHSDIWRIRVQQDAEAVPAE